jgi:hypothetical protein
MQEMFINEPQRAVDALALGMGFLELKQRPPRKGVYDWTQAG